MTSTMSSTPSDSGVTKGPHDLPGLATQPSDESTRIISAAKNVAQNPFDNATVIVAGQAQALEAKTTASVAGFAVTRAGPSGSTEGGDAAGADTSLLAMGTRVAEFEITRVIGQGGFGVVYEAWDHTLERVVAIKEYMPSSLASRQSDGSVVPLSERHKETFDMGMRSFINEARLLAQFDHPALLKVYRFWQERGTTYMVMPCYKGDTLKHALAEKKDQVDEQWLLGIVDGVTQALAVMHRANCYHRDIAPDNIMLLEPSGLPVVLDFGAARRVITDMTQAITVILKPGYAPIEQYSETPDMSQGAWTDVYALCAVMYAAITGRPPPPSVARLLNDRCAPLSGNPLLLERFSAHVLAAVDAGLAVRPESRLQSMAALRAALGLPNAEDSVTGSQQALAVSARSSGSPSRAAPLTGQAEQQQPSKSKLKPVLAIASVAGVALVAGGVWWSQSSAPNSGISSAPAPQSAASAAAPPTTAAATPPPAPVQPFSASKTLSNLLVGASAGFEVTANPGKPEVRIGKDKLEFQLRSNKAGYVYVYYLSSGGEMYLLFPNALDKRNRIEAGASLSLPRPSWAMDAGGPAGVDEFVALVSEKERDLKASGIQYEGVFGQFSTNILSALEAARANGPSPLLGSPLCEGAAPCADNYGAISFKIVEK
jgi:serine/threonine protein kinase